MTTQRHYGMDWLRIGAFGLLILYHIGMYFVPWGWHVKIAAPLDWTQVPMMAVNPWRLGLLFVVSGFASHALFSRMRGPGEFVTSRTARLLIPLVAGMVIIIPAQPWVELMFKHGYTHGFAHFWLHDYFRFDAALGGIALPTWNHLWFVVYLWVYSLLLGAMLWIIPERVRAAIAAGFGRALSGWLILIVPILLLAFQEFILLPGTDMTHALIGDWAAHVLFFPMFLFGYLLMGSERLWAAIRTHWRPIGLLAIAGYAASVAVELGWSLVPAGWGYGVYEVARMFQGWGAIVALIGLADRYLDRDLPARPMLTEAVFPFYIIHQTTIVLLGWWLIGRGYAPGLQFAILLVATVASCWAFYLAGREIGWLRPLIGLKPCKRAAPVPAAPQAQSL
ncbi:acyltransferase family protein [Sphingosinicella sp. LHD-64]|uniref:acyltransferase family protein n=1 Tax=Sphingosinicella sp. LHD-64 TaxID=3072139 RepID=UPI00280F791A|nr:acyltransferase family protein [Sphingosinicella sp. LHD-64]MDQ8758034.1 acyltransferase family protein [Sphingosinicella sp. LHD-64]